MGKNRHRQIVSLWFRIPSGRRVLTESEPCQRVALNFSLVLVVRRGLFIMFPGCRGAVSC